MGVGDLVRSDWVGGFLGFGLAGYFWIGCGFASSMVV